MIRSAFFRRMAQVAMAGMLGAELAWRAPKIEEEEMVEVFEEWRSLDEFTSAVRYRIGGREYTVASKSKHGMPWVVYYP